MSSDRIDTIDYLRALAALAVCLFHFNGDDFVGIPAISSVLRYGYLGVDAFFVISGFVIPFALYRSGYTIKDCGAFFAARFLRLYPAYLATCVVIIALWHLSAITPGFQGDLPQTSAAQLISNALLICEFTGESALSPVFWTLAIEAQYYLLIAASMPFLSGGYRPLRWIILGVWIVAPLFIKLEGAVFSWTALFAIGILGYLWRTRQVSRFEFSGFLLLAAIAHLEVKGYASILAGGFTIALILIPIRWRISWLAWLGSISYSLYLLHATIGGRIINLTMRLPETWWIRIAAVALALLVSLVAAALFYYFIEKPSHQFSRQAYRKLKGKSNAALPLPVVPVEAGK